MKVNFNKENIYKNKILKKCLKFSANNSGLFVATTSVILAGTLRPAVISMTPKTDKENRKLAIAKSFASAGLDCMLMTAVSLPLAKSVKRIDKNPEKYLEPKTISNLTDKGKTLIESNSYKFSTQLFKLGSRLMMAAPKAIISCAMIPTILKLISSKSNKNKVDNSKKNNKSLSFTGKINNDYLTKSISKVLNNEHTQNFANKFKDTNFGMHMMAIADSIATLTFAHETKKNKNIKEDRKSTLINNALISTGLSIISGYAIDKSIEKPTNKFIDKFSAINKNDKDLNKYIEGIKIAKPALILGGIYYGIIPLLSTFFAERTTINSQNNHKNDKIGEDVSV